MSLPTDGSRPRLTQALALGALHGPAELLPISSSAHIALVPWLLGWDYGELDPELRKEFEVALHAGTAAALLIVLRGEIGDFVRAGSPRLLALVGLASAPAALAGYTLERQIERRLGTPATIAAGLIAGGLVLAWADRTPGSRTSIDARAGDALWLGVAQACALFPGVSRSGATLAAARRRGFRRADARRLSRHMALPVIAGAALLKAARLRQRGLAPGTAAPLASGLAASFGSSLATARLIRSLEHDRSLAPYAAYRIALATAVLRRLTARPTTMAP
jgi:undecaprenyl-diphosphatase